MHRAPGRFCFAACPILLAAVALSPAHGQAPDSQPASAPQASPAESLASRVPADAAIYLEIRGLQRILGSSTGAGLTSTIFQVLSSASTSRPAESGPADPDNSPRHLFAKAVGLEDSSPAIGMLFSGQVAVAADGWSGLSDAVLLAWPADPQALEKALAPRLAADSSSAKVRRYSLGNGHELACDGRTAVIGRIKRTSVYARTLELLDAGGQSLADTQEFRERTASIAGGIQIMVYVGRSIRVGGESPSPLTSWWPDDWPRIKTLAFGLAWNVGGAHAKLSARLDAEGPPLTRSEPPIQVLRRLPASVVAVWTQAIDYAGNFRRMRSRLALEPEGFHFESLEVGLESGIIEKRILSRLVGDTVVVMDQVAVVPREASPDSNERVVLPVGAILVETDDPDGVAGALPAVAENLVRLFNSQAATEQAISLQVKPLEAAEGAPLIYSIPVGTAQAGKTQCDLLQALELSWAVDDRWLIVATHSQTVRRLVQARRDRDARLAVGDLDKVVEQVAQRGGQPRRVLFAQPRMGSTMVESWIQHISKYHPEMLQAQWWERLLRRQQATGKQIGILARADHGVVEVVDTLPDGPARSRLLAGDRILAVDGRRVDAGNPLQSLRENVAQREQPDQVVFLVRRGDEEQEIALVMPRTEIEGGLKSPVELLKRLSGVWRLFGSATYVLWQPKPDVVEARIDLRYFVPPQPEPAATQPAATQPTDTQPAATQPSVTPVPATQPASTQPAPGPPATTQPATTQSALPQSQPVTAPATQATPL